uniref:COMM domain-containing protein n=1 Tax=Callorhinchus milii TaxID=7868 RepID=A0A4W3H5D4_CALMI
NLPPLSSPALEQGKLITSPEDAKNMLTMGQLVDLQWKLGMAVSSDSLADSSDVISRSFEMTIPQFQNFSKQFREMASVRETVRRFAPLFFFWVFFLIPLHRRHRRV